MEDFVPISLIAFAPLVLVVHPSVAAKTVKELVALARSRSDLNYTSGGTGSLGHLAAELFKTATGARIEHVPYKGSNPAIADLLSGTVQLGFFAIPGVLPHIRAGRLRALGVTSEERMSQIGDIPTLNEAGVRGYEWTVWYGVLSSHGTRREIIQALNASIRKALEMPELRTLLQELGVQPKHSSSEEFGALIKRELQKCAQLVQAARIPRE